ncbi:uncharacterized protein [Blastocystis hominis]|uniref:Uncharacterized protein n=1 Tax=Blastocystis hominis TaxID=12968 RepID=D8LZZ5_BLAHO|nr:uncharacterized protein [Blastocystis hominis]CBK21384.2 unnamed protein product [Blastocystis hominis]|eukprot:XP_012895432.1 uncharacterized protein [Blastocystis hominis]
MGNTKVLAVVYGPRDAGSKSSHDIDNDKATVSAGVTMAPYCGTERRVVHMNSRICTEYAQAIRRCFEHVILTTLYPHSTISIHCTIFQADGGELPCCLNAALLAIIDAGIDILDFQVSLNVGYMDNTILFDMNYVESHLNGILLTVAYLPKSDQFTLTTLNSNIPLELFEDVLDAAKEGCKQVYAILKDHVLENAKKLYQSTQQ